MDQFSGLSHFKSQSQCLEHCVPSINVSFLLSSISLNSNTRRHLSFDVVLPLSLKTRTIALCVRRVGQIEWGAEIRLLWSFFLYFYTFCVLIEIHLLHMTINSLRLWGINFSYYYRIIGITFVFYFYNLSFSYKLPNDYCLYYVLLNLFQTVSTFN